jgi:predicted 3-demethylubiquinone-9 3-methyltransferase (glyoxalase superfamily)
MHVMVIVKATKNSEAGVPPDRRLREEMGRFNEELVKARIMVTGEGLHPSRKGKRVRFAGGRRLVTDGPFAETKELVAGFWIWKVKCRDEAARFYVSIFPGSRVERVATLLSESPAGPPGSVKIVDFVLFGRPFRAIGAGPHHPFNDAVSMVGECEDQAERDRYRDALVAGGGRPQACGWLIDRFGLRWQIVPAALGEMMADPDRRG